MSKGVNKAILVGHLGADPEVRYTANGSAVTNISLATSDSWKDRQTGERQERTEWHRIVCFNKLAEIAGEYLKKGSKAYFEGRLQTRKWTDQSGNDRYTTEIVANDMQMLDSKSESVVRGGGGGPNNATSSPSGGAGGSQGGGDAGPQDGSSGFGFPDEPEDIPFLTRHSVW